MRIRLARDEDYAAIERLHRQTIKSTITAKDFYEKNGYKIIKKTMEKIGDKKLQIYVMSKKLN